MTYTEARPEAQPQPAKPRTSYVDRTPTGSLRLIERRETKKGLVAMMSEVQHGIFVGWDMCHSCATHIRKCVCEGGPTEPPYVRRWREERNPHTTTPVSIPTKRVLDTDVGF